MYLQDKLIISEIQFDESTTIVNLLDEESNVESQEEISSELLPFIKTEEPIDASELQKLTVGAIEKELLTVLLRFSPRLEDIRICLQRAGDTIMRNVERADDLFYGIPYLDRRISVYHKILLEHENAKKEIPMGK